ncbi:MAG: hypothetical protein QGG40_22325, partial [Myxococcota bacterium]|nr:hypothetical protein [Myxococcota bacterium]
MSLAMGTGAAEVALRASPRLGLSLTEVGGWVLSSVGVAALYLLGTSLLLWAASRGLASRSGSGLWLHRGRGLLLAALLGVHGVMVVRFEFLVNALATDPRLWVSVVVVLGLALAVGM